MGRILARKQQSLMLHSQILSKLKRIESFSLKNRHLLADHQSLLMQIYEEASELQHLLMQRLHGLQDRNTPQAPGVAPRTLLDALTPKEYKLLNLFAKGFSYQESADYLGCKLSTIQTHIKRIYKKLGVHSRAEAVHEARLLGLLAP